jgi:hypothetical protein
MTKTLVISKCSECPCEYDGMCNHPDLRKGGWGRPDAIDCDEHPGIIPPACPLRTEPLHVHLAPQRVIPA